MNSQNDWFNLKIDSKINIGFELLTPSNEKGIGCIYNMLFTISFIFVNFLVNLKFVISFLIKKCFIGLLNDNNQEKSKPNLNMTPQQYKN